MPRFITSPGVHAPSDRPRVDVRDPLLPAQGALLLLEPGHPSLNFSAAPVNGQQIPNVAWEQSLAMVGSGNAQTLGGLVELSAFSAPDALLERTSKGGLHGIVSQRAGMAANHVARVNLSDLLRSYLIDNPTHDLAITLNLRSTRASKPGSAPASLQRRFVISGGSISADYLAQMFTYNAPSSNEAVGKTNSATYPNGSIGTAQFLGARMQDFNPTPGQLGPRRWSLGVAGWNGTAPTTLAGLYARLGWGPYIFGTVGNDQSSGGGTELYPSWVLYWLYIEDLTVSGRTWAQVEEADRAKYLSEVVNPGGRYYGDSFTDPATLP